MPLFGPPNLDKLIQKKDIKGLNNAVDYGLKHQDVAIAIKAAFALADLKIYSARGLMLAIFDKNPENRRKGYVYFGQFKYIGFIPLLTGLHDTDNLVRMTAIFMLKIGGDYRAIQPIGECLLYDESKDVRVIAATILGKFSTNQSLDYLLKARDDNDPDVRKEVDETLKKLGY